MSPRKLIERMKDHNRDIRERLFVLLSAPALTTLLIVFIGGFFIGESAEDIAVMGMGLLVFFVVVVAAVHFNRIRIGANIIAFLLIFVIIPGCFFTGGGMQGGMPIWFVFSAVFVCLLISGKERYVFMAGAFLVTSICYYVAYRYPETVTEHSHIVAYLDSYISVVLVGTMICLLFVFETRVYISENRLALNQKQEIEELGKVQNRFFSSMSHEIRTPINTIIGLNEMILREEISDEVAEDARNIETAGKMLLQLINDILDMSKIEAGKMEITSVPFDLGDMLSEVVGMIWVRAKDKGLVFHVDIDPDLPKALYGDEVRLKQILINVLTNAVKYTKQGSVTFRTECKKKEDGKAHITYSITDTGIGIRKESMPYLFSAFKRADLEENRYIEGTGLGLSIVKQLVDMMGGDIKVNSVYTKGTTFIIELEQEIADESRIGDLNLEARHSMNLRRHYRQSFEAPDASILVVDDNEANLIVVTKLLRDTKVKIDTAISGKSALQKTLKKHYDLIFMDHLMPEMDGIECLNRIRTQTGGLCKNTPVTVLTANAESSNKQMYKQEGFDGYLVKPVSGELLEAEVARLLPRELMDKSVSDEKDIAEDITARRYQKKFPVLITTDSVCDLPKKYIKSHNVAVLPYHVHTDKGIFLDGVETESRELIAYIVEKRGSVHSDPPEIGEYEAFFAEQLLVAGNIIHITMSSKISKGYYSALEAAKSFDNVTVIDSGHLSSGMGLLVLDACRLAEKDMPVTRLVEEIERRKARIQTSFVVDSTEYLAISGRISAQVDSVMKALYLHPVLQLRNGRIKVETLCFGTGDFVWKRYISGVLRKWRSIDKETVFITYSGLNQKELERIENYIRKKVKFDNVVLQEASPAISTNCGPGSFGILYRLAE
ncbi:MAG: DegV family EDD domain-containing protein [Lachnospiraceae bacterium]|nr:DegV family EDD domain-containing protein [Lachnospiraceae bacterium]